MNLDDRDLASDLVDARVDKFLADRGGGVRWIGFGRKHLGEGDEQERGTRQRFAATHIDDKLRVLSRRGRVCPARSRLPQLYKQRVSRRPAGDEETR